MRFDIVKYFIEGGWVMWPILGCSVLGVAFTIERIIVLFLQKRRLKPDQFLEALEGSLRKNGGDKDAVVAEMKTLCEKRGGACGEIMYEGLEKYTQARAMNLHAFNMRDWLKQAIESRANIALPQLESHLNVLAACATIAPLLGLFGTVIGMIQCFEVMASAAGGAKPDELAAGISVALITTAGGLMVAIPILVLYNWLKAMIESYVMLIEEAAVHLVDRLIA